MHIARYGRGWAVSVCACVCEGGSFVLLALSLSTKQDGMHHLSSIMCQSNTKILLDKQVYIYPTDSQKLAHLDDFDILT